MLTVVEIHMTGFPYGKPDAVPRAAVSLATPDWPSGRRAAPPAPPPTDLRRPYPLRRAGWFRGERRGDRAAQECSRVSGTDFADAGDPPAPRRVDSATVWNGRQPRGTARNWLPQAIAILGHQPARPQTPPRHRRTTRGAARRQPRESRLAARDCGSSQKVIFTPS